VNFKGASDLTIDLIDKGGAPVVTLIGLNESGKTTILEGMSHFVSADEGLKPLFGSVHSEKETAALMPLHKKAAFTGKVKVVASVLLDDNDLARASITADTHKHRLDLERFPRELAITMQYDFRDSVKYDESRIWDLAFNTLGKGKTPKSKKYEKPAEGDGLDLWLEICNEIERRLPKIAYFPTFLVDTPEKIYLAPHAGETAINKYYREVFQEILDSLNEELDLQKHVSKRISDYVATVHPANWLSAFFVTPTKGLIDSLFQKIASAVTKEVLGSWKNVFQRSISAKNVLVDWGIDTEKSNLPYASFKISDDESLYAVSDRSLGFRWFFSFLLFTAFKQKPGNPVIFMFDEPAANLHAKAQAELLKSFARITAGGHKIVYSTHSHHMINPAWLSSAYIVENAAIDYDAENASELPTAPTNIRATKYRQFVSKYGTRSSYFQPVIEKLEYVTPAVLGSAPYVIVEGISDFYILTLASKFLGKPLPYSLMPGSGAGASGPLISLLMGRGERFVLLLDDDSEGKKCAKNYAEQWFLSGDVVLTLKSVSEEFFGKAIEKIICNETTSLIAAKFEISSKPSKKQISLYFSEMCATNADRKCIGNETQKNAAIILTKLAENFQTQE
jgi:ABC-type Mn2+/Zn2+ transport system ATPase subunit